jgi:hypothetical protein
MVLRLAEALGASLREANELLHAAGLPAAYPQAELASPDLAPYRAAIERLLAAHEPYPAMALDARYTVVAANRPCAALFGPQLVGSNFVRDALADPATAQKIVNWPQVAWAGLDRLRQDARRSPFDSELRPLISLAEAALDGVPRPSAAEGGLMVCPWFRIGSTVVRTIAMTARFDHPTEVTLDELHIELMYPMDDDADRFFRADHSQVRLPPHTAGPQSATGSRLVAQRLRHPLTLGQPKCLPLASAWIPMVAYRRRCQVGIVGCGAPLAMSLHARSKWRHPGQVHARYIAGRPEVVGWEQPGTGRPSSSRVAVMSIRRLSTWP